MGTWSWASVASPSDLQQRSYSPVHLSDRPLAGQVDRLAATIAHPLVEETVLSPLTASLTRPADLGGFQSLDLPGNDASPTELLAPLFKRMSLPDERARLQRAVH